MPKPPILVKLICTFCKKTFQRRKCRIKGKRNYCSVECRHRAGTSRKYKVLKLTCAYCGKIFMRNENRIRYDQTYCSVECAVKINGPKRRKYVVDDNVFLRKDAISYYLLGVWMTDGCITGKKGKGGLRCTITTKDRDWMESIRDLVCPTKPVSEKISKHNGVSHWALTFQSQKSIEWLMSYGCVPRKTYTLRVLKKIPHRYIPDFIRGVLDGDGTIYHKTTKRGGNRLRLSIVSASKKFIEDLIGLLPKQFGAVLYRHKNRGGHSVDGRVFIPNQKYIYVLSTTGGAKTLKMIKWLYYNGHPLSLNRKNKKAQTIIQTVSFKKAEG